LLSGVQVFPAPHCSLVVHSTHADVAPLALQTGVVPPQGAHVAPQESARSQNEQAPVTHLLFAPQLVSVQLQVVPPAQVGVVAPQAAQVAPHLAEVSQDLHALPSQNLPAPHCASFTHATHAPALQIWELVTQFVQLAPQCRSPSHARQVPLSQNLPPPVQSALAAQSLQTPFVQPNAHFWSTVVYVQLPAAQAPGETATFLVCASAQDEAGGVVQLTPTQGSPLQEPFTQPNSQNFSSFAYAQLPVTLSQVPTDSNTLSLSAALQKLAGGNPQILPLQGFPLQAPASQPN